MSIFITLLAAYSAIATLYHVVVAIASDDAEKRVGHAIAAGLNAVILYGFFNWV